MARKLEGRRIVVTGASRGIGFESTKRFLSEGASVLGVSRDGARLASAASALASRDLTTLQADLTEPSSSARVAAAVAERWGAVDVLFNNAAILLNEGEPPSFEEELAADVIEIITVFSARLYGSRSHKTKRLLNELTDGKGDTETEEPVIITKSMKPEDFGDEAVRDLLASMEETQLRAMSLYAKLLRERDR